MSYQSREIGDHAVIGFEFPDPDLEGGSIVLLDRPEDQGARPGQTVRPINRSSSTQGCLQKVSCHPLKSS